MPIRDRAGNTLKAARGKLEETVGGPARLQVILLLAAVLGLDTADKAAVSATADSLKQAFGIGNTDIGVLISVVSFVGAIGTLPMGVLVDKTNRERLLTWVIALWAVAMVVSGTATSFLYLLIVRLFLGLVTAAATPAVASLIGDYFAPSERARIYGFILAGELVGTGFGFILAGEISSFLNWSWAFIALAVPSGLLSWIISRYLPEPARGGRSRLAPGQQEIVSGAQVESGRAAAEGGGAAAGSEKTEIAREVIERQRVEPRTELILRADPVEKSLWWAARYVLKIPTNVLLIIASALGYFFFAGVRAFAMIYITKHYGISRSSASPLIIVLGLGAIVGVMGGGRLADWLLEKGHKSARITVPAVSLFLSVLFFAPAIWTTDLALAMVLFTCGAIFMAAANSPIDAARLDIMHPRLWGRAESVRTTLRMLLEGAAPTLFGFLSQHVLGSGGEKGLEYTYLLMLLPLLAASWLAVPARRTYPVDVATANASLDATSAQRSD